MKHWPRKRLGKIFHRFKHAIVAGAEGLRRGLLVRVGDGNGDRYFLDLQPVGRGNQYAGLIEEVVVAIELAIAMDFCMHIVRRALRAAADFQPASTGATPADAKKLRRSIFNIGRALTLSGVSTGSRPARRNRLVWRFAVGKGHLNYDHATKDKIVYTNSMKKGSCCTVG